MSKRCGVGIRLVVSLVVCVLASTSCSAGLVANFTRPSITLKKGGTQKNPFVLTNNGPDAISANSINPMSAFDLPDLGFVTPGATSVKFKGSLAAGATANGSHSVTVGYYNIISNVQKYLTSVHVSVSSASMVSIGSYDLEIPSTAVGIDITGGAPHIPMVSSSLGYNIKVKSKFKAEGLGLFDQNGDGVGIHDIGLWSDNGTNLLATVQVGPHSPEGYPSMSVPDNFRYVKFVEPIVLKPGIYTIAAYYPASGTDAIRTNGVSVLSGSGDLTFFYSPGIEIVEWVKREGGSLEFPDTVLSIDQRFMGPTIFGSTPEPSSFLLAFVAGIGGWYMKRRRAI